MGRGEEQSSQGVGHPRSRLQKEQPAIQGEGSDPRETLAVRWGGVWNPWQRLGQCTTICGLDQGQGYGSADRSPVGEQGRANRGWPRAGGGMWS